MHCSGRPGGGLDCTGDKDERGAGGCSDSGGATDTTAAPPPASPRHAPLISVLAARELFGGANSCNKW